MRSNDNPSETKKTKDKTPFSCQRDGLTLRGHVFGKEAPGKPAVIISHGFLATEKTVFDYARALAAEGYLAVTFDFNGGGIGSRSDGKSEDMTLLTEKADLLAVTEAVNARYQPAGISCKIRRRLSSASPAGMYSRPTSWRYPARRRALMIVG